jgi:toxin ParE1/3/4
MKIAFDREAIDDLIGIYQWIAQDDSAAARLVIERLLDSIEHLGSFPNMGRSGRDEGTREWPVPRLPYIVVYEVSPEREELLVLAIFHGAQDRR